MSDQKQEEILKKEKIQDFEQDIRTMSKSQLIKHFSFKGKKSVNTTLLIKNLIWQGYTWIKNGQMEPIEGNIRSFWYMNVKPVISRLGFNTTGRKFTEKLYGVLVEMIVTHRLFRYMDMGFLDERQYQRSIGKANGSLILFVEKDGLFGLAKQMALQNDTTAIATGGFPSYLTLEYLLSDMARAGLLYEPVHVFSVVDYDPSGYWIEQKFLEQLRQYDIEIASQHSLITPDLMPASLLDIAKYRLDKSSKTKNWLKLTNGLNGEPYGLESDAVGGKKIRKAFETAILPYLPKKQPVSGKASLEKSRASLIAFLASPPAYLQR